MHIETLLKLAYSPRFRSTLEYRINITSVPNENRMVQLPASEEQWRLFLKTACQQSYDWHEAEALKLSQRFGTGKYSCTVHCQCKLIQHLQIKRQDQWDKVPPFSYIGMSKLTCAACNIWIKAFNKQGGRQFYSRGSGSKWAWPWGMPSMGSDFDKLIAKKLRKAYIVHAYHRSRSVRAHMSLFGVLHGLTDDQRKKAATHTVLEREFGGDGSVFFGSKFPGYW